MGGVFSYVIGLGASVMMPVIFTVLGVCVGITMAAVFVADPASVTNLTDHLNCRVLAFRGKKSFTYWAGASWSLAGEVTTPAQWHAIVNKYGKEAK